MTDQIATTRQRPKRESRNRKGKPAAARANELHDQKAMIERALRNLDQTLGRPLSLDGDEVALSKTLEILAGCAAINCTKTEAAGSLGVSLPTLRGFFERYPMVEAMWENSREGGRASLRRWQWKAAEKGNAQMLQFLGVNELGQTATSKQTVKHDFGAGLPLTLKGLNLSQLRGLAIRLKAGLGIEVETPSAAEAPAVPEENAA